VSAGPSPKPALDVAPAAAREPALQAEPADTEPRQSSLPTLLIEVVEDAGDWSACGAASGVSTLIEEAAAAVAQAAEVATRLPRPLACAHAVIALSDNDAVAALNAQYRGMAKPTNVLSFPAAEGFAMPSDGTEPVNLGDIVLAAEMVAAEAADLGIAPGDHLRHLVVHGLLHLLGYDHIDSGEADEMEALETRILATLGIADPYAGSDPADATGG
jgi:probable rRNA maturation factor